MLIEYDSNRKPGLLCSPPSLNHFCVSFGPRQRDGAVEIDLNKWQLVAERNLLQPHQPLARARPRGSASVADCSTFGVIDPP
jgi:hypothetical protein